MAISLECGIVFTVPGVAALALASVLDVPVGRYLIFGLIVVIPTVVIAIAVMNYAFRRGFWNSELDEDHAAWVDEYAAQDRVDGITDDGDVAGGTANTGASEGGAPSGDAAPSGGASTAVATAPAPVMAEDHQPRRQPSLLFLFTPLLASLVLIATGAIGEIADWSNPVLIFLSDPVIALLLGLIGTCLVGRTVLGQPEVERSLAHGLSESGQILLLKSLAAGRPSRPFAYRSVPVHRLGRETHRRPCWLRDATPSTPAAQWRPATRATSSKGASG